MVTDDPVQTAISLDNVPYKQLHQHTTYALEGVTTPHRRIYKALLLLLLLPLPSHSRTSTLWIPTPSIRVFRFELQVKGTGGGIRY